MPSYASHTAMRRAEGGAPYGYYAIGTCYRLVGGGLRAAPSSFLRFQTDAEARPYEMTGASRLNRNHLSARPPEGHGSRFNQRLLSIAFRRAEGVAPYERWKSDR